MKLFPFIYSLKVWGTALVLGSLLLSLIWREGGLFAMGLLFGFVFSLPIYLIFLLFTSWVFKQEWTIWEKKIMLVIALNFFMGILWVFMVKTSFENAKLMLAISFFAPSTIAVLINKSE